MIREPRRPHLDHHDWQPLAANAAGTAQLNDALARLRVGPGAGPASSLPPTAATISGRKIVFGPGAPIRWARVDFGAASEATMSVDFVGEPATRVFGVGLDGRFRPSHEGRPLVARGAWTSPSTFETEIGEGPGIAPYRVRVTYGAATVRLEAISANGETRLRLEGRLEA